MGVYYFPVRIVSEEGCLKNLGDEVIRLGAQHPLIVTDPGIVKAGILDKVTAPLKAKELRYDVFEGVEPDPKIRNVTAAVEVVKRGHHDLLVGLGGGSSIDTAKAASILSVNAGDIREFQGIRDAYPERLLPLIGIPTTAGTGSEISSSSVIIDEEKKYKMFLKSPQLFARAAQGQRPPHFLKVNGIGDQDGPSPDQLSLNIDISLTGPGLTRTHPAINDTMVTADVLLSIERNAIDRVAGTDPGTDIAVHTQRFFNLRMLLLCSIGDRAKRAILDTNATAFALPCVNSVHGSSLPSYCDPSG